MSQIYKSSAAGPVPPSVATSYVTDNGVAVPAANILNVLGGVGASTSGAGNTITINVTSASYDWSEQNASFGALPQNAYFCNVALTVSLPPSGTLQIGDSIIIYVDTIAGVTIQADVGESIQVGSNISALGGTASSNTRGAILELVFKPSDSTWHTISSMGVWTIV